jgi:hypothetical protein
VRRFLTMAVFCAAALCACRPAQAMPSKISGMAFSRTNVSVHQGGTADARRKIAARGAPAPPRKSLGAWTIAGPAAVFLFYLIAWLSLGPEPKPGALVARYEPPEGLSPAAARYIVSGTTDGRSFAAVIAQLAVRGCVRVESVDGKYKLSRLMSDRATVSSLAEEEKDVLRSLFEDAPVIELSPAKDESNAARNGRYVYHIHRILSRSLAKKYFTRHSGIIALGLLATFVIPLRLAATADAPNSHDTVTMTLWVLLVGLFVGLTTQLSLATALKSAFQGGLGWSKVLPGIASMAAFAGALFFLLFKLAASVSLSFPLMLVAFLVIHFAWAPRLRRKTPLGREVAGQIEGFRQFLEKVERDRLNRVSPSAFERKDLDEFLPYAIALEVTEAWGDRLSQTFSACTVMVEK